MASASIAPQLPPAEEFPIDALEKIFASQRRERAEAELDTEVDFQVSFFRLIRDFGEGLEAVLLGDRLKDVSYPARCADLLEQWLARSENAIAGAKASELAPGRLQELLAQVAEAHSLVEVGAWRWTAEQLADLRRQEAEAFATDTASDASDDMDAEDMIRALESGDPDSLRRVYGD